MARRRIRIAGIGPFIHDDVDENGDKRPIMQTDGEVSLPNIRLLELLQRDIDIETLSTDYDVTASIITLDFQ